MYLLKLALFMFKFQAKQLPSSFLDYFKLTNAIHAKQTRSSTSDSYFLPCYKTIKLQRSIKYQGAKQWNPISRPFAVNSSVHLVKKFEWQLIFCLNTLICISQTHMQKFSTYFPAVFF